DVPAGSPESSEHAVSEHAETEAPEMTEEAMMEMMMKMGAPGPEHELLATMAGEWNAKSKMSMSPDAPATETDSTSSNKMILGGRYLQCDYQGLFMGQPYHGMGLIGFDNTTQQYQLIWIDNSGTTMTNPLAGTYDESTKQLTVSGSTDNPMYGTMTMREVFTLHGPDSHSFEMFMDMGAGETSSMTIDYTRK
ncbi:MAG: hypothetical protein ACI8TQ_002548, partial [Planctomycetota bacterium]